MLQEVRQLERLSISRFNSVLEIANKGYLGIPVRNVFIALSISFLTQRSDDIPKSAQALVYILSFFQSILVIPSPTLLKSFRTSEVNKVERAFASISTRGILSGYSKSKDRV